MRRWRQSRRVARRVARRLARGGSDGFTLMEVIVALAVLALLMGALFGGLGQSWRGIRQADQQSRAMALAKAHLAMVGSDVALGEGRLASGDEDGIAWTLSGERYRTQDDGAAGAGADPAASATTSSNGRAGPPAYWLVFDASWPDGRQRTPRTLRVRSLRLGEP